jgi:hypothetical protein
LLDLSDKNLLFYALKIGEGVLYVKGILTHEGFFHILRAVVLLVFDPGAVFDSGVVVVFDFPDLADRIGELNDLGRGLAAGEDEVEGGRSGLNDVDDLGEGDQFEVDGDVDLIQDDHVVFA